MIGFNFYLRENIHPSQSTYQAEFLKLHFFNVTFKVFSTFASGERKSLLVRKIKIVISVTFEAPNEIRNHLNSQNQKSHQKMNQFMQTQLISK